MEAYHLVFNILLVDLRVVQCRIACLVLFMILIYARFVYLAIFSLRMAHVSDTLALKLIVLCAKAKLNAVYAMQDIT